MQAERRDELPGLRLMIGLTAAWLALCAIRWELGGDLFFLVILFACAYVGAIAMAIFSALVRTAIFMKRSGFSRRALARLLTALTCVALLLLPFKIPLDDYYEDARLRVLSGQFAAAADWALASEAAEGPVELPFRYGYLTRGGRTVILCGEEEGRAVLFYAFRGMLDNFSVYAYAPNDAANRNLMEYADWFQVVRIRENWYFCASR